MTEVGGSKKWAGLAEQVVLLGKLTHLPQAGDR